MESGWCLFINFSKQDNESGFHYCELSITRGLKSSIVDAELPQVNMAGKLDIKTEKYIWGYDVGSVFSCNNYLKQENMLILIDGEGVVFM